MHKTVSSHLNDKLFDQSKQFSYIEMSVAYKCRHEKNGRKWKKKQIKNTYTSIDDLIDKFCLLKK